MQVKLALIHQLLSVATPTVAIAMINAEVKKGLPVVGLLATEPDHYKEYSTMKVGDLIEQLLKIGSIFGSGCPVYVSIDGREENLFGVEFTGSLEGEQPHIEISLKPE